MFYVIDNKEVKLALCDDDRHRLLTTLELMPQYKSERILETDIITASELLENPNKVIIDDIEIETDVPDYDEGGNPIMIVVEETIEVIDYDDEGNPVGSHTEVITKLVPSTHKETITVKGLVLNPDYETEEAQKERQRLDALTLTPADVERALYKEKQMDFEDLKTLIATQLPQVDTKALSIEFRAKDFYRGAMYGEMRLFDVVGALLGYTPADMDYLFEHKELPGNLLGDT